MKKQSRRNTRWRLIGTLALALLVALSVFVIQRTVRPERFSAPDYYPTQNWRSSTPEELLALFGSRQREWWFEQLNDGIVDFGRGIVHGTYFLRWCCSGL